MTHGVYDPTHETCHGGVNKNHFNIIFKYIKKYTCIHVMYVPCVHDDIHVPSDISPCSSFNKE